MPTPHPDKAQLIALVSRLFSRSGLTIGRVLARMQTHGCDISRATFENRLTTRIDQKPNLSPPCLLALVAAFTERLTERERCTAAEALELARLTRLPLDQLDPLAQFFPAAEFNTAFARYAPHFASAKTPKVTNSETLLAAAPSLEPEAAEIPAQPRREDSASLRRWLPALALGLALVVALIFGFNQWRQLRAERRATLSQRLAARARDVLAEQLDLALLLSSEAYRIAPTYEARDALLTTLQTSPALKTFYRGHTGWVWSVAFSPDGQTLASGSADGTIHIWNVATGQPLNPPLVRHTGWIRSVTFSPDDQLLASGSADGTIILWEVKLRPPLSETLTGHTDVVRGLAFSPDGQTLASASHDFSIRLWNVDQRQPVGQPLTGHAGFVNDVAFSADGRILASASDDKTVRLWEVKTGQPLGPPLTHPDRTGVIQNVEFRPGSQTLLANDEDRSLLLWDIKNYRPLGPPLPFRGKPVAFSPDGKMLVAADSELNLWDVATGQRQPPPFTGFTRDLHSLAFSPNGQLLVGGGEDNRLFWWDVSTRHVESLTGHTDWINSVAFSPDGQLVASGAEDGTIILWDVSARQPLGLPFPNGGRVWRVVFSPDGYSLASAGRNDGTILLWNLDPESWQQRICRIVARNLTLAEWQWYLPTEPYHLICPTASPPGSTLEMPQPTPTSTPVLTKPVSTGAARPVMVEEFDSDEGFIQTSQNLRLDYGRVFWHFQRNGGKQFIYRRLPVFDGDVRITVQG